jgi:hypothetical protein
MEMQMQWLGRLERLPYKEDDRLQSFFSFYRHFQVFQQFGESAFRSKATPVTSTRGVLSRFCHGRWPNRNDPKWNLATECRRDPSEMLELRKDFADVFRGLKMKDQLQSCPAICPGKSTRVYGTP